MGNNEQIECNSVILAALLHDVGKFLHRGSEKYNGEHEDCSAAFLNEHRDKLTSDYYDLDLVILLVRFHHCRKRVLFALKGLGNTKNKERIWNLLKLVKRADSYSCKERDLEQERRKGESIRKAALDSIFSVVNLDAPAKYRIEPTL